MVIPGRTRLYLFSVYLPNTGRTVSLIGFVKRSWFQSWVATTHALVQQHRLGYDYHHDDDWDLRAATMAAGNNINIDVDNYNHFQQAAL